MISLKAWKQSKLEQKHQKQAEKIKCNFDMKKLDLLKPEI